MEEPQNPAEKSEKKELIIPKSWAKLIRANRVDPIVKVDNAGVRWLLGFSRKKTSRKKGIWLLPTPELIVPKEIVAKHE